MYIRSLTAADLPEFAAHFARHVAESGRDGDPHFMPFAAGDPEGPRGLDVAALDRPLSQREWQRWFVALTQQDAGMVGHVNLKGDGLKTGLHRCELGIGIERSYRGRGLGAELMQVAIDYARAAETLAWVDLKVFAHNTRGRALYQRMDFIELGTIPDRFRIDGQSIDDVLMALNVA